MNVVRGRRWWSVQAAFSAPLIAVISVASPFPFLDPTHPQPLGGLSRSQAGGLAAGAVAAPAVPAGPAPTGLTVEGLSSPVDIENLADPLMSWQPPTLSRGATSSAVDQQAYQVLVGTTSSEPNIWNSGKVVSGQSQNVPYAGRHLVKGKRYWFTVRTWDGNGKASSFAVPSTFGTGLGATWAGAAPIWSRGSSNWLFAREQVKLPAKTVAWATLFATASSPVPARQYVYKLYVNGHFVGSGPTRSIGSETRYDGYDVTADMVSGKVNAIGAQLYTTDDHRFLAKLVVHYTDGTEQSVGTSSAWAVLPGGSAYPASGSVGTQYYAAPKENVVAARFPSGYATAGFDARSWQRAQTKPAYGHLMATPTGKVVQADHAPVKVTHEPNGDYLVDFGRSYVGGVRLEATSPAPRVVGLEYGEILDASGTQAKWRLTEGNDQRDFWTLAAGKNQLETWGVRVFRYVTVRHSPVAITSTNLQAVAQLYPFDESKATFTSSNSTLNAVWALSRNTTESSSGNLYVDSWTRERRAYEADAYIQQREQAVLSPDSSVGRYTMDYLLATPTYPTEWRLYQVLSVHDAYQMSGDLTQVRRNYAQLQKVLLTRYIDSTGLVHRRGNNDLIDRPRIEADGYVRSSYSTVINALTYQDLVDMSDLAKALGLTRDADRYTQQAVSLRRAINDRLYDRAAGAYRDGLESHAATPLDHHAEQASAFALAFGVPEAGDRSTVAAFIAKRGMVCSVYCAAFLLPGLYSAGAGDVADAMLTSTGLRSWANMLSTGTGATMEDWDPSLKVNTTYSHPWGASPTYDVTGGLFGILPVKPGFASFAVRPQPGATTTAAVTTPTVRGPISVSYLQAAGHVLDVMVQVPSTSSAQVTVPVADSSVPVDLGQKTVVFVDGTPRQATRTSGGLTVTGLLSGCHLVSNRIDAPVYDTSLLSTCSTKAPVTTGS